MSARRERWVERHWVLFLVLFMAGVLVLVWTAPMILDGLAALLGMLADSFRGAS